MLNQSCESLPGVGPILAQKLAQVGLTTLQDLLFYLPYRYQDRTRITPIQDLRTNDWCVVHGTLQKVELKYGKRPMLDCYLDDRTGILKLRFFHFNKQQLKTLSPGMTLRAFGEVREFAQQLTMIHPEYQLLQLNEPCPVEETLTPIYSSIQGLSQVKIRQLIKKALFICKDSMNKIEWMNEEQLIALAFQPIFQALEQLHLPPPDIALQSLETGRHPGLRRLAFEELLAQQLSMTFAKLQRAKRLAVPLTPQSELISTFISQLPFQLTSAQYRVFLEIEHDLQQPKPMLRLIQGDVGSGKTLVATLAALHAVGNNYQVAMMVPTDILSEQHYHTLHRWLTPLGISVYRLSGKMKVKERRETLDALKNHQCQIIIGTHALFQTGVEFARLGLVIIDEQHRFGVEQRLSLTQKANPEHNQDVHQLLMTATPIPRSLAMTHYAHLDLSIIDELPSGRTPVTTVVLNQAKRDEIITRLASAITQGRQIYWVCTLIEESEQLQCIAATASSEYLQQQLPHARVGLIHGRLKEQEKLQMMTQFKQGALDILVATTVIEVGVDVANASLMIIENAERLGLSQLHQLRGRVGRGTAQSHCLLLYQAPLSPQSQERLRIMRATSDGFIIAEKDLELRGAGEVLGTRQTGYYALKIANLPRDRELLTQVPHMSQYLLNNNPPLAHAITKRWLGEFEQFLTS